MSYSKKKRGKNAAKNATESTLTEAMLAPLLLNVAVGNKAWCALKKRHDPF